ncbi:Spindle pole body-associated protein sad1 [Trametes pubescens]|uniref:Spindle pole body-associated protein sad1 n=1 Tax=Trametes pubescens TaxID=154538 RepID=A0A1M2W581_TRAPU|nr:Spindle pole body-associated protein sad1 [Trametes pubescens]
MAVNRALREVLTEQDFALAIDGAKVVSTLTPDHISPDNSAKLALRDNLHGGKCWKLRGVQGQIGIRLSNSIHPTSVTIDHLPREVTHDIDQAPRRMTLWGVVDGPTNHGRYAELGTHASVEKDAPPVGAGLTFAALSRFEYNIDSPRIIQTFPIHDRIIQSGITFSVFVLEVETNWGGNITCIYRVRLHGVE